VAGSPVDEVVVVMSGGAVLEDAEDVDVGVIGASTRSLCVAAGDPAADRLSSLPGVNPRMSVTVVAASSTIAPMATLVARPRDGVAAALIGVAIVVGPRGGCCCSRST